MLASGRRSCPLIVTARWISGIARNVQLQVVSNKKVFMDGISRLLLEEYP